MVHQSIRVSALALYLAREEEEDPEGEEEEERAGQVGVVHDVVVQRLAGDKGVRVLFIGRRVMGLDRHTGMHLSRLISTCISRTHAP